MGVNSAGNRKHGDSIGRAAGLGRAPTYLSQPCREVAGSAMMPSSASDASYSSQNEPCLCTRSGLLRTLPTLPTLPRSDDWLPLPPMPRLTLVRLKSFVGTRARDATVGASTYANAHQPPAWWQQCTVDEHAPMQTADAAVP